MRYLFIPGAGGAGWLFHRVVPLLPDAVAVDLPAGDPDAGLAEYAAVVVDAAGDWPDDGYTVVGQSMGALTAPLVCDALDVRRLVLLNPMIPAPYETGGEWWAATRQAEAMTEEYDLRRTFFHDVPAPLVEEALAHEQDQSERPFSQPWPLAAWPDVPTRVVVGREDRLFPPDFQRRVARERLGLDIDVLPGGHLLPLSQPAALADYLLRLEVDDPAAA